MAEPTAEEIAAAQAKAQADADAKAKAEADAQAAAAAEKKFSQADLDRIAGSARTEGRSAYEKEILSQLGVDDLEAAKAQIAAAKAAEDANKSELQKATEALAAAQAREEAATRLATTTLAATRVETALRDAGVKPDRIPAALKLIDLSTVKVDGTAVTGVAEAVEAVKTVTPEWFGTPVVTAPQVGGGGGGGATTDFRTASKEELDKELLRKYNIRL